LTEAGREQARRAGERLPPPEERRMPLTGMDTPGQAGADDELEAPSAVVGSGPAPRP